MVFNQYQMSVLNLELKKHWEKMNLRSYLKPYIKINSKWKINIRRKTTELTEENKEKAWFGQRFCRAQKVQTTY